MPALLTLLGKNGADDGHESAFITTVSGEEALSKRQNAQNNVSECFGKCHGSVKVVDWDGVLAELKSGIPSVGENTICGKGVGLFLVFEKWVSYMLDCD